MKKTVQIVSFILALLMFSFIAAGVGEKVTLNEIDMSFTAPDGWTVLTRDVSEDEQYLSMIEISRDELVKHFKKNGIYADLVTESGMKEIHISKFTDGNIKTVYNLNDVNAQTLENVKNDLLDIKDISSGEVSYTGNSIVRQNGLTYIVCEITVKADTNEYPAVQYYTIYNGIGVTITYSAYDGTLTEADKTVAKTLIDSLNVTLKPRPEVSIVRSFLDNFAWLFFSLAGIAIIAAILLSVIKKKKAAKAALEEQSDDNASV